MDAEPSTEPEFSEADLDETFQEQLERIDDYGSAEARAAYADALINYHRRLLFSDE